MAGTRRGGLKAAQTNKERYGESFYTNMGRLGGQKSRGGGFSADWVDPVTGMTGADRAREAGAKGGKASRRTKVTPV